MNKDEIRKGLLEYAEWLKETKHNPQHKAATLLNEKVLKSFPVIDPKFEEKKLVFALRNGIEKTAGNMVETLLKPIKENVDQNPEYYYLLSQQNFS